MLTAEELAKKKQREAELQWQRILAYYMMETYVTKAQALAEAEMRAAYHATSRFVMEHGLLRSLFENKKGNGPSPAELLSEIGKDEPPDSPLGELWAQMRSGTASEEKLTKALTRVIVEKPPRILAGAQKEQKRRAEWERLHAPEKDFLGLIDRVNIGREPKVKAADFDLAPPAAAKAREEPVRELMRGAAPR